jgi:hypothetical protein
MYKGYNLNITKNMRITYVSPLPHSTPLPQFRVLLVQVLLADVSLTFLADRVCLFLFGEGKLRADLRR